MLATTEAYDPFIAPRSKTPVHKSNDSTEWVQIHPTTGHHDQSSRLLKCHTPIKPHSK